VSNEIGINLKKHLLIVVLIIFAVGSYGFEPERKNFANSYQFELYNSWLKKGNFKTNFPAGFTKYKIVKTFEDNKQKNIEVEYDLKKMKIINQRETLPFIFVLKKEIDIAKYIRYLESFIYRLNANNSEYLFDFVDLEKIELKYSVYENETALDILWKSFANKRVEVKPIELDLSDDKLGFIIPTSRGKTIRIYFKISLKIDDLLKQTEIIETSKSPKIVETIVEKKIEDVIIKKTNLAEFIKNFYNSPPARELLHNKISNPIKFLQSEFPNHKLIRGDNKFFLKRGRQKDGLHADIGVIVAKKEDGIYFRPLIDHKIINNKLLLNELELIDLSEIPEIQRDDIAEFLPHLIYEHRTLGSKLLNFILIHDDVQTTLVLRGEKREIYEMKSYADLLLLLGNFWQNRDIYFSITEIKKKNGLVEMKGFLIAKTESSQDLAEIKFLLNKENKIDLIMMILYTKN